MLSHRPEYWAVYYRNAVNGTPAHSVPMSLNSPMMMLTWWDAYAYAKWKGRELVTELEWERAARGTRWARLPVGRGARCKAGQYELGLRPEESRQEGQYRRVKTLGRRG